MRVEWTGAKWTMTTADGISVHPTANGQYPDKTGWPDIDGVAVSLDYGSNRIDANGNLVERDMANYKATQNLSNEELIVWTKMAGGGCGVKEDIHYAQGTIENMTAGQYAQAVKYIGEASCGTAPAPFPVSVTFEGEAVTFKQAFQ